MLINMVEHSPGNAKTLTKTKTTCSYDSQQLEEDSIDTDAEVIGLEALTQVWNDMLSYILFVSSRTTVTSAQKMLIIVHVTCVFAHTFKK